MPADALPVPHQSLGALTTTAGFTLTFGAYADPAFVGMKAVVCRSAPLVDSSTGAVSQQTWTVTIAPDGTASLPGLSYNDDGTTYSVEWQAIAWKPTPGNRTFQVLSASGLTMVDYDTLTPAVGSPITVPASTVTPTNLDGLIAGLLADRTSATYRASLGLPTYPNGA